MRGWEGKEGGFGDESERWRECGRLEWRGRGLGGCERGIGGWRLPRDLWRRGGGCVGVLGGERECREEEARGGEWVGIELKERRVWGREMKASVVQFGALCCGMCVGELNAR